MKNTETETKIHWLNLTTQQTQKHNKHNRKKDQWLKHEQSLSDQSYKTVSTSLIYV